jgi:predicted nucleotidyltransferase
MLEGFSPDAVSEVRRRLDEVRASSVRILFAIESGSRAWGFPSPDSDYDCRFVYLRSVEDHLKLSTERDVIEFPIEGEIDTGGWDLHKALLLALKGNAVIGEWVHSPHVYEEMAGIRERLAKLLDEIVDPKMVARHYFGLLKRHDQTFSGDEVKLKKLFYALRPAFSLQYMEERDFAVLPPMNLQQLLGNIRLPAELSELVAVMVEEKAVTREMGLGTPPERITRFLAEAHQRYGKLVETLGQTDHDTYRAHHAVAERFYIDEVRANDGLEPR